MPKPTEHGRQGLGGLEELSCVDGIASLRVDLDISEGSLEGLHNSAAGRESGSVRHDEACSERISVKLCWL